MSAKPEKNRRRTETAATATILERRMTEPVIGGALLVVLQDVVSLAEVLELLLGRFVARICGRG